MKKKLVSNYKLDMAKVLRFNLSQPMTDKLNEFHAKYFDESKKDYKINWQTFIENNREFIEMEERTLINSGFTGDIHTKLYTSVKYYISKKKDKNDPKERRDYVHINKDMLSAMDNHILENTKNADYTPAKGFTDFVGKHETELILETNRLRTSSELSTKEIEFKIKKTYKNRYFILRK